MPKKEQTNASTFSIEDIEPFELPNSLDEGLDTEMIEIQEQNIAEKSKYENLDNILDFLSQGISTNFEESVDWTQTEKFNSIQNTSEILREIRAKRAHLNRSRRRKGAQKCDLELQFQSKGYWTKNFLQNCKKPHFKWLQRELGPQFLSQYPTFKAIKQKNGISMDEYLSLYQPQQLKDTWRKFFSTKYLHREVILSRAQDLSKEIFMKFHHRFEQAFITGKFDHIA